MASFKIFLFFQIGFFLTLNAQEINPESLREKTVLEEIQKGLLADFGLVSKEVIEEKEVLKEVDQTKKLGLTGNDKLDRQILKNRLKLQKRDGLGTKKILSGKEKIQLMLKRNREKLKNRQEDSSKETWLSKMKKKSTSWQKGKRTQVDEWLSLKKALIKKWQIEKSTYNKNIHLYKKKSLNSDNISKLEDQLIEKYLKKRKRFEKVKVKKITQTKIPFVSQRYTIKNAFAPKIRHQNFRPTCSSFAAIRGIEILLAQKGQKNVRLSEQYFYWLSKPSCQQTPCTSRGSSYFYGVQSSQRKTLPDIPLERNCPYQKEHQPGNETQIPLKSSCFNGHAKVKSFKTVNSQSLNEIIDALHNNYPLIAGMKLSPNYYKNKGYVFMKDLKGQGKTDHHSAGHAMLLVGYMKLPKKLHSTEGKICLLTANSWGTGWGVGGYSCLSHKWILHHMRTRSQVFLAMTDTQI